MRVLVIGAGASGMLAALTAAETGHSVTLLERQARVGRKLMATGNGRCNFTNTAALEGGYHGGDESFIVPAMSAFPPEKAREYFASLGLLTVEEYGGRVYPLSNSANSVVDVLRYALDARGVALRSGETARSVRKTGGGFRVVTDENEYLSDALIVACGGMAGEKLGGTGDGYALLSSLGHSVTPLCPALAQILTEVEYPRSLKGVRADCRLSLLGAGETASAVGEVQFTEKGVSGPAAFELSRRASTAKGAKMSLCADFLFGVSEDGVYNMLKSRRALTPELPVSELFCGMLHNRLGRMVCKYAALSLNEPLGSLHDEDLKRAVRSAKGFTLRVTGVDGFREAQVTAGGVRTEEFDPRTLESRIVPRLFACGEVLDVDGDCGGYNLQWAWASGRLAGRVGK